MRLVEGRNIGLDRLFCRRSVEACLVLGKETVDQLWRSRWLMRYSSVDVFAVIDSGLNGEDVGEYSNAGDY